MKPEITLILPGGGRLFLDSALVPRIGEHVHFNNKTYPVLEVVIVYVDPGCAKACTACGAGGQEQDHYQVRLGLDIE